MDEDRFAEAGGLTTALRLLPVAAAHLRQEHRCRGPRRRLLRHQARALHALRQWAAEHSPFYRAFHRGLHQQPLHRLPVLDKATLMQEFDRVLTHRGLNLAGLQDHLDAGVTNGRYLGRYVVLSSSGSTGLRGIFVFDRREWIEALAAITRPLAWSGAPRPWTRPRTAFIASTQPWHYSHRVAHDLANPLAPSLACDAAWPLATLVQRLNAWQPQVLALYPSVLATLAEEQRAGRLRITPKHIGTSAEVMPESLRERVRTAFGLEVFDTYGATELAPVATQCEHGYLHLLEDRALVEVVDQRGDPVPTGETGEQLLLTVFDRRTQPLIRYALNDRVRELPGICPCGRHLRRLAVVEGRREESLSLPSAAGGAPVELHPNLLHAAMERVACVGWQVRQIDLADEAGRPSPRIEVLLVGSYDAASAAAVEAVLQALVAQHGAISVPLQARWVDALPRGLSGKAPLVVRQSAGAGR